MRIGDRTIGIDPPYVIAELGVNHDGRLDRALRLVEQAADAGADAIKLQYFEAGRLLSVDAPLAAYQARAGAADPISMLRGLQLSLDHMARIVREARERGLHAIVTIFSRELVPRAKEIEWDAFKVASPDVINLPLLEALAACGKPMLVSTGASSQEDVVRAVGWLRDLGASFRLMQCVSAYPTPAGRARLNVIPTLARLWGRAAGYSDHTVEVEMGAEAVEWGAVILEKHLTWNREAEGPDHAASLDPAQFARYVELAREALPLATLQGAAKRVLPIEYDVRTAARQSLVSTRALPAGHTLTSADVTIKRPGTGIEPFRLHDIIGRPLVSPIAENRVLTAQHLGCIEEPTAAAHAA